MTRKDRKSPHAYDRRQVTDNLYFVAFSGGLIALIVVLTIYFVR